MAVSWPPNIKLRHWHLHCVIVVIIATQHLLSWNQDERRRVWHGVNFVFKLSKLCLNRLLMI